MKLSGPDIFTLHNRELSRVLIELPHILWFDQRKRDAAGASDPLGLHLALWYKILKSLLFLKKKKQKDFYSVALGGRGCTAFRPKLTKVFCFFSSEKKTLSAFLGNLAPIGMGG